MMDVHCSIALLLRWILRWQHFQECFGVDLSINYLYATVNLSPPSSLSVFSAAKSLGGLNLSACLFPSASSIPFPFHSFFGHLFTRVVFSLKKESGTGPCYSKSGLDGIS
jgi:hypothetical protein